MLPIFCPILWSVQRKDEILDTDMGIDYDIMRYRDFPEFHKLGLKSEAAGNPHCLSQRMGTIILPHMTVGRKKFM